MRHWHDTSHRDHLPQQLIGRAPRRRRGRKRFDSVLRHQFRYQQQSCHLNRDSVGVNPTSHTNNFYLWLQPNQQRQRSAKIWYLVLYISELRVREWGKLRNSRSYLNEQIPVIKLRLSNTHAIFYVGIVYVVELRSFTPRNRMQVPVPIPNIIKNQPI